MERAQSTGRAPAQVKTKATLPIRRSPQSTGASPSTPNRQVPLGGPTITIAYSPSTGRTVVKAMSKGCHSLRTSSRMRPRQPSGSAQPGPGRQGR